ncbi:hypothetical protein TNCV_1250151 [Trichonephila clavipes]|nr:hypothetical protein TNCV_1250151 [Trichonephila clavipes]
MIAGVEFNADIYRRIVAVYGKRCLGQKSGDSWCKSFREESHSIVMTTHTSAMKPRQLKKNLLGNVEQPPYSPKLSPCVFNVLRPLKKVLRFYLDDEVKETGQDF